MTRCCYECGKAINGEMVLTNPPVILMKIYGDFPKAYHKRCYDVSELRAAKELNREEDQL